MSPCVPMTNCPACGGAGCRICCGSGRVQLKDQCVENKMEERSHETGLVKDQPPPVANVLPAVWDLVIAEMKARDRVGCERYGVPLQPHNGRDALVDMYQELLDAVVYCRQMLYERNGR